MLPLLLLLPAPMKIGGASVTGTTVTGATAATMVNTATATATVTEPNVGSGWPSEPAGQGSAPQHRE